MNKIKIATIDIMNQSKIFNISKLKFNVKAFREL